MCSEKLHQKQAGVYTKYHVKCIVMGGGGGGGGGEKGENCIKNGVKAFESHLFRIKITKVFAGGGGCIYLPPRQ